MILSPSIQHRVNLLVWAVKTKDGDIVTASNCYNLVRKDAAALMHCDWDKLYRQGYRCVKVQIKEVDY